METRVALWTVLLCALVSYWIYANSKLEIDYERHFQLVDQETGIKHKPSELLDLAKVIHITPQYINSTSAVERLYELAHLFTSENPFVIDQSYSREEDLIVSGWPVANQTQCTSQLEWILNQLNKNANYTSLRGQLGYELTNFMDSFGRPEPGLFSGSIHWLGSHKKCLASSLDGGRIKTRYCIAKMRFKSWPQKENIYPATRMRSGICLPETCDTLSYKILSKQINQLAMFDLPERFKDNLETDAIFCLPDERSPLRQIPIAGRIFLVVVGVWVAIVIAATFVYELLVRQDKRARMNELFVGLQDSKKPLSEKQAASMAGETDSNRASMLRRIIVGLSIRVSLKTFKTNAFRVKYNQDQRVRLNLGGLDFFKVCMTLLVVLAHAGYLGSTHTRSIGNRIELNTTEYAIMSMAVGRCVDTFFLLFGILTSYNLLKKFKEHHLSSPMAWMAVNVGILARIGPLFMFVFWYSKLIAPYTSSGPWWDYGVDNTTIKGTCFNEPWWKSIPYLGGSGKPSVPACNLPSWFIVSYSQLSLLLPLITYLIYKLPGRAARFVLVGFLLTASAGSIALRLALQTTVREEGITLYGAFLTDLLEKFESTGHLTTLGRLGAVSLGCIVGYLLRCYEEKKINAWPRWLASGLVHMVCFVGLILIAILPIIGKRIYLITGRMATWTEFVGTEMLLIILWPILVAIPILFWTTERNHIASMRFFSHSFWHAFNRLGLCIFLIHWEILYLVITGFEQAPSYGFLFDILKFWCFGLIFSLFFAFIIHILLEAPMSNFLMILFRHLISGPLPMPTAAMVHSEEQQKHQLG